MEELERLRSGLLAGDPAAYAGVRHVGHSLAGSGATYGFPEISQVGTWLEDSPDGDLLRRMEGTVTLLGDIAGSGEKKPREWLRQVLGASDAEEAGIDAWEAAHAVARHFGLDPLDPPEGPMDPRALRLVPPALLKEGPALPLGEDAHELVVAVADPTDFRLERKLEQVSGRAVSFRVAPRTWILARARELRPGVDGEGPSGATASIRRGREGALPSVLLVDDDAMIRVLARSVLEKNGFQVQEAGNGEEALRLLVEEGIPDLAVIDLQMPGMDGRELLTAIRENERLRRLPVVVLTGSENPEVEAELIEQGADDYIRKPLDARLFLARVQGALRRASG